MEYLLKIVLYLIASLPFRALHLLADFLYVLLYYVTGYRRKVVRKNLALSFPELSDKERKKIEKQFYHYLAEIMLETVKSLALSKKDLLGRVTVADTEGSRHYLQSDKGAIILTGHFGNWEWAGLRIGLFNTEKPVQVVYLAIKNKAFNSLMKSIRSRFGNEVVHMEQSYKQILKRKEEKITSCFLADQTPQPHQIGYWGAFLNQMTPFYTGPEKIARKTGLPVYFGNVIRTGRGRYRIEIGLISEFPTLSPEGFVTAEYVLLAEKAIREQPYAWLWSHKRWKHHFPGDEPSPGNISS